MDVKKIFKSVLPIASVAISLVASYYNEKDLVDKTTKQVLESIRKEAGES